MSVPPQIIRVKRKATEDAPVSFLRVQQPKRIITEADFVYKRQNQHASFADIPSHPRDRPVIHVGGPRSNGGAAFQSPKSHHAPADDRDHEKQTRPTTTATTTTPAPDADSSTSSMASEPRRFHMSRADAMLAASNLPPHRAYGGISKKRNVAPTLFIERKSKRLTSTPALQNIVDDLGTSTPTEIQDGPVGPLPKTATEVEAAAEPRKRKKPGLAKEAQSRKNNGTTKKAEPPASMTNRSNVDMDQLAADMNAFAMEQIGLNLRRMEEEKQREKEKLEKRAQRAPSSPKSPHQPRFKPKAPARRYAERHPEEQGPAAPVDKEMTDIAETEAMASDTDDDEYIIETYVRVPASSMDMQNVAPQNVGLLVFDAEPDLEFFYGDNSDSEDEWAEDEDDENAENYYAADYPDDEVASDDEFGYNAYAYRTGNASDLEEFDADAFQEDPSSSDDKDGFKSFVGRDGRVTKHL